MHQHHDIQITRDNKRCGFFVVGSGFDFFAYYTCDPSEDGTQESTFIECDHVEREGEPGMARHMMIKLGPSGIAIDDIVHTAICKWLGENWTV